MHSYSTLFCVLNFVILCLTENNKIIFCKNTKLNLNDNCYIACHEELTQFLYDFTQYEVEIHCPFPNSWNNFSRVKINFTSSEINTTDFSIANFNFSQDTNLHNVAASLGLNKIDNIKLVEPKIDSFSPPINVYDEFRNIKKLFIDGGKIYSIPRSFLFGLNLNILEITNTFLKKLNFDVFTTNTHLVKLDLSYNAISRIEPLSFDKLSELRILNLNFNRLNYLPLRLFDHLKKLVYINLENNKLNSLSTELFHKNKNLEEIYLNNNQISSISHEIFNGLTNLKILSLGKNKLLNLPANLFQGLNSLEFLSIDNNQIQELPVEIFSNTSLRSLDLASNRLTKINPELFNGLSKLMTLDISGNECENIVQTFCQQFSAKELFFFSSIDSSTKPSVKKNHSKNDTTLTASCNDSRDNNLTNDKLLELHEEWTKRENSMLSIWSTYRNFLFIDI